MSKARAARQLPKSWPENISYLTSLAYSKTVSPDVLKVANSRGLGSDAKTVSNIKGPSSLVKIVKIKDPRHPANGQYGHVHGSRDADPNSDYDLSFDRELGIGVDASKIGNEARFINDFRGVSASPNAEFRDVWVDIGKGFFEKRMAVYVLPAGKSGKRAKGIAKGEEILVSYGKGFWMERQHKEHGDIDQPDD